MKRFLFTVVLLLGLLVSSAFSSDPENSTTISSRDSATLEVKFQNPRLVVSDERTSEAVSQYLEGRDSLYTGLFGTLDRAVDIVERDQERRYESAMDYLSRRTQVPPDKLVQILSDNISRKRKLNLIFSLLITILVYFYILRDTKLIRPTGDRLVSLIYLLAIGVALYLLYCSLINILSPIEFEFIKTLTQLSG